MDLTTSYLGYSLRNPLVASSSPLCAQLETVKKMVDAGVAAIVLPSLFEEQLYLEEEGLERRLTENTESYAEALTYFPPLDRFENTRNAYLAYIHRVKKTVDVPVFASLNGMTGRGWIEMAKAMEEAGADGIELNLYFLPTDPTSLGNQVEQLMIQLVKDISTRVAIPVAVKVGPFFSAIANILKRIDQAGAKGIVLFNRFYQPDIDLETLDVVPRLTLSTSEELRLRLRWTAILYPHLEADIAITGGVHTAEDALKAMMVGARVVMMTSAILRSGAEHFKRVLEGMVDWMTRHGYQSIREMQGSMSLSRVEDPSLYERANYLKVLGSWKG